MSNFNNKIIPAFYINITEKCNMKCEYCPTYGENWESTDGLLIEEKIIDAINVAHKIGIESFRISGGEPMIFPKRVFKILDELNKLGVTDIILNTNGFNSYKYIDKLKQYKIKAIKISIDTLDNKLFKEITNTDKLDDVVKSIKCIRDNNIPIELNMVVFKKNANEFWKILDMCVMYDISIKLLDLVHYDILVRNNETPDQYWKREYFYLEEFIPELVKRFGEPNNLRLSNNRGIPMIKFKIGGTSYVTLKDGTLGSTYADVCKSCRIYPCQEGLFHLSLSAEGNLTPCRLRRDLTISIRDKSAEEIEKVFFQMISAYQNPFFIKDTVEFPLF